MAELSGLGNTIIVVEHDRDIINSADWIVELGPEEGIREERQYSQGQKINLLRLIR